MQRSHKTMSAFGVLAPLAALFLALGSVLSSCLPDLPAFPAADASAPTSTRGCGDGVVQQALDGGGEQCDPGLGKAAGCTDDCRILCDEAEGQLLAPGEHCYFSAGTTAVFAEASDRCRKLSAHVVTLASIEEEAFVARAFPEHWLGLGESATAGAFASVVPDEPGFPIPPQTGPCPGCFGGLSAAADAGILPDPTVDGGSASCTRTSPDSGPWLRVPCTYLRALPVVCEREPAGSRSEPCVGGVCITLSLTRKKKSYLYVPTPVTASQARASCAGLGGALVVFSEPREREEIAREVRAILPTQPLVSFWVGLADEGAGFQWDDGAPETARPSSWGEREPRGRGRAYLQLATGSYDTALLHSETAPEELHAYLCERASAP